MMNTENENIFCIECKCSIESCFCSCPYCGEQKDNCCCNITETKEDSKLLPDRYYSKRSLKISSTRDDGWWRLEKWQVGRRNFP